MQKITRTLPLLDLGPNLGAINRAALLAADCLAVVPSAADRFSLQGLRTLGPAIREWNQEWARNPSSPDRPAGTIKPIGYVVQPGLVRLSYQFWAYEQSIERIPHEFQRYVLADPAGDEGRSVKDDPRCLALLKHYHGLMPMAHEAQKPMFHLTVADGAIGAHLQAAQSVGKGLREPCPRANRHDESRFRGLKLPPVDPERSNPCETEPYSPCQPRVTRSSGIHRRATYSSTNRKLNTGSAAHPEDP